MNKRSISTELSGLSVSPDFVTITPQELIEQKMIEFMRAFEEFKQEMIKTTYFCSQNYNVDVSRGSGYQDFVNGLLSNVYIIQEQYELRARGENLQCLFAFRDPKYIQVAIASLEALQKYFLLLRTRRLFAENESLVSIDSHRPRSWNIFEPLVYEVKGDRKRFVELVMQTSDSRALALHTSKLAEESLRHNSPTNPQKVSNE